MTEIVLRVGQFNGGYNGPTTLRVYDFNGGTLLYENTNISNDPVGPSAAGSSDIKIMDVTGVTAFDTPRDQFDFLFLKPPTSTTSVLELEVYAE